MGAEHSAAAALLAKASLQCACTPGDKAVPQSATCTLADATFADSNTGTTCKGLPDSQISTGQLQPLSSSFEVQCWRGLAAFYEVLLPTDSDMTDEERAAEREISLMF